MSDRVKQLLGRLLRFPGRDRSGARYPMPPGLRAWMSIMEVDDAEAYAGELFRHCFRHPPPGYPRHYVARYRGANADHTIGYVHLTPFEGAYLGGGLCIDERLYRRMPQGRRDAVKAAGGIAEQLARYAVADAADGVAVFVHVGDKRSEAVISRVGFRHAGPPHLFVYWSRPLADEKRRTMIEKVAAVGSF